MRKIIATAEIVEKHRRIQPKIFGYFDKYDIPKNQRLDLYTKLKNILWNQDHSIEELFFMLNPDRGEVIQKIERENNHENDVFVIPDNKQLPEITTKNTEKRIKILEKAAEYSDQSLAENSKLAYEKDLKNYIEWCNNNSFDSLEPETIIYFITSMSEINSWKTLKRKLYSISKYLDVQNISIPPIISKKIRTLLKGIKNVTDYTPKRKQPLVDKDIKAMINVLDDECDLMNLRNRTMILVGYDKMIRRDASSNINFTDCKFVDQGLIINLQKTKTDKHVKIGLKYNDDTDLCPVLAVQDLVGVCNIYSGPLFRQFTPHKKMTEKRLDGDSIGRIIKKIAAKIGKNIDDIGAHSLRIGKAVQMKRDKRPTVDIMKNGRWKTRTMVDHYTQEDRLFDENDY